MTVEENITEGMIFIIIEDTSVHWLHELHAKHSFQKQFVFHKVIHVFKGMVNEGTEEFIHGVISLCALFRCSW